MIPDTLVILVLTLAAVMLVLYLPSRNMPEGTMSARRWVLLESNPGLPLSAAEVRAGWHRCPDWDGLLIGPGMEEQDGCTCAPRPEDHP